MNALDNLATTKTTTTKTKVKVAAKVTPGIKESVDIVIKLKAKMKVDKATLTENEDMIIEHVREQQDELGFKGNHTKSMVVAGTRGNLLYTTSDKFSISQDDEEKTALKKLVKAKLFEEFFETKRVITLKADIVKDDKKINAIVKACKDAGMVIADTFEVVDKLVAKKGLDTKMYKMNKKDLQVFRTLVKQNKPALKG